MLLGVVGLHGMGVGGFCCACTRKWQIVLARSGGIILEGNSVSSLVYTLGGAINKKTRCNAHYLLEQPRHYILLFFGPHQASRFETECLVERNEWTHLLFILLKCGLVGTRCRRQFSGQHTGANQCETGALTGHG